MEGESRAVQEQCAEAKPCIAILPEMKDTDAIAPQSYARRILYSATFYLSAASSARSSSHERAPRCQETVPQSQAHATRVLSATVVAAAMPQGYVAPMRIRRPHDQCPAPMA